MDIKKLKEAIKERESTPDEWDEGVDQCHAKMLTIIKKDPEESAKFNIEPFIESAELFLHQ